MLDAALRLHQISEALFALPAWAIGLAAVAIGIAVYFGLRARRRD